MAKVHANKYFPTRLPIVEALWKALQLGSLDKHAKKRKELLRQQRQMSNLPFRNQTVQRTKAVNSIRTSTREQENKAVVEARGETVRERLQLAPLVEDSAQTCGLTVVPSTSKKLVEPKRVEMVAALRC